MAEVSLDDKTATGTDVSGPIVIDGADAIAWDDACDLLVVGIGLAGASAVLRANELGNLDIIAVDRFLAGGSSEMSGGVVYAGGTHVQAELGIVDSPENMFNYLGYETGELISEETLRRFCEDSPSSIPWLEKYGVKFGGPVATRKCSYPPKGHYLYYSGNETTPEGKARANPAPRGHRAMPSFKSKAVFCGVFIMTELKKAIAEAVNVRRMYQTAARRLVVDKDGCVLGAELWQIPPGSAAGLRHRLLHKLGAPLIWAALGLNGPIWRATARVEAKHAKRKLVRARHGVILSAGGFVHNLAMMKRHAPLYVNSFWQGNQGDDGSGIQLGATVGGATSQLDNISAWRFISPPYDWPKGIIVAPNGLRITNEEQYGARISRAMYEKADGKAWLIIDQSLMDSARQELARGEMQDFQKMTAKTWIRGAKKSDTIPGLETALGVPAGSLSGEVEAYNQAIAQGTRDPQGKSDGMRAPLANGPFYALDLAHMMKSPLSALTMGGLSVDEATGGVRAETGGLVPGLYAAGRNATGLPSNEYISGLSLADCVWSGWRAATAVSAVATAAQVQPAAAIEA